MFAPPSNGSHGIDGRKLSAGRSAIGGRVAVGSLPARTKWPLARRLLASRPARQPSKHLASRSTGLDVVMWTDRGQWKWNWPTPNVATDLAGSARAPSRRPVGETEQRHCCGAGWGCCFQRLKTTSGSGWTLASRRRQACRPALSQTLQCSHRRQ